MVVAPASLADIARQIDARLRTLLEGETQRWSEFDADLTQPFQELSRLVFSGGKHLRSAFCFWGFVGAGGDPGDHQVIDAGAAIELMHAFALFRIFIWIRAWCHMGHIVPEHGSSRGA